MYIKPAPGTNHAAARGTTETRNLCLSLALILTLSALFAPDRSRPLRLIALDF
jgi:hypothetical protein